jgi:hypothetical protein
MALLCRGARVHSRDRHHFRILREPYLGSASLLKISEIPEEVGKLVNLYNFYVNDNKVSDFHMLCERIISIRRLLENSMPTSEMRAAFLNAAVPGEDPVGYGRNDQVTWRQVRKSDDVAFIGGRTNFRA